MAKKSEQTKGFLNREQILNMEDLVTESVFIPAWDGYVCVRALTARERDKFENDIVRVRESGRKRKIDMKDNIRARLVALSVVDSDTGKPLFSAADVEALGNKSAAALDTIYDVAQRLSKLSDDDVEELAGNFSEAPADTLYSS